MIGIVGLVAILAVVAAAGSVLLTAVGLPWIEGRVRRLGLRRRAVALEFILAGPLLAMLALPLLCLLPSLLAIPVPSLDHCLHHTDHPIHLCLVHIPTVPWAATAVGVGLSFVLGSLVVATAARRAWRSARMRSQLAAACDAEPSEDVSVLSTDHWLAFTLGFIHPRVYVSARLRALLGPAQWSVVLFHERTHVRRRDPLRRMVLHAIAVLHLPFVRRRLLALHELAVEQTCDEAAATACGGDRLLVAETLLALERLSTPVPAGAVGAFETQLESRVRALLERPQDPASPIRGWVAAIVGLGLLALANPVHHLAEHALGHWLL